MLKERTITSAWYAILLVIIVWFGGGPGFTTLVVILGILAALEFYRMVASAKPPPLTYFGLIWTAFFILSRNSELLSRLEGGFNPDLLTPLLITSAVVLPLIGLLTRRQKDGAFTSWVWTVAGIFDR